MNSLGAGFWDEFKVAFPKHDHSLVLYNARCTACTSGPSKLMTRLEAIITALQQFRNLEEIDVLYLLRNRGLETGSSHHDLMHNWGRKAFRSIGRVCWVQQAYAVRSPSPPSPTYRRGLVVPTTMITSVRVLEHYMVKGGWKMRRWASNHIGEGGAGRASTRAILSEYGMELTSR